MVRKKSKSQLDNESLLKLLDNEPLSPKDMIDRVYDSREDNTTYYYDVKEDEKRQDNTIAIYVVSGVLFTFIGVMIYVLVKIV